MKKLRLFVFFTACVLGLLTLCWSRAQAPTPPLKVIDPASGKEIHTLMLDQQNALVGHLEAAGQTNAIELFRQYRCAYSADLASSELADTVAVLQHLRDGQMGEAIQRLEQHLGRYANLMCNSYGCLSATNRERVKLEPVEKALNYYTTFPPPATREEIQTMKRILKEKSQLRR
jgi:hypothetical protein